MEAEDLERESRKALHMPFTARKFSGTLVVGEAQSQNIELENESMPFWNFLDSSLLNSFLPLNSCVCVCVYVCMRVHAHSPEYVK